jgi:hypothetical protein
MTFRIKIIPKPSPNLSQRERDQKSRTGHAIKGRGIRRAGAATLSKGEG